MNKFQTFSTRKLFGILNVYSFSAKIVALNAVALYILSVPFGDGDIKLKILQVNKAFHSRIINSNIYVASSLIWTFCRHMRRLLPPPITICSLNSTEIVLSGGDQNIFKYASALYHPRVCSTCCAARVCASIIIIINGRVYYPPASGLIVNLFGVGGMIIIFVCRESCPKSRSRWHVC